MQSDLVIWLAQDIYKQSFDEATFHHPLETGGALMGYWVDSLEVVVTASIGAGPHAVHNRYSFEPDYEWQQLQIEEHYYASGRRETYLGDWHTHPDGFSGHLSWEDKRALRCVASSEAARAPNPICLIFFGGRSDWQVASWCAAIVRRRFLCARLITKEAELRLFQRDA